MRYTLDIVAVVIGTLMVLALSCFVVSGFIFALS